MTYAAMHEFAVGPLPSIRDVRYHGRCWEKSGLQLLDASLSVREGLMGIAR